MAKKVTKPTVDDRGREHHPSFGKIVVSRCSGVRRLFDSVANHQHYIMLSIHRAVRSRDLSDDWIHPSEEVVEVMMSETQFARMISSVGMGDGTPCTLSRVGGEPMDEPELSDHTELHHSEIQEAAQKATKSIDDALDKISEMEKGKSVRKADLGVLRSQLASVKQAMQDNIPFVVRMAREKLEDVVDEAKSNFDAFVKSRKQMLGHEDSPRLPGDDR